MVDFDYMWVFGLSTFKEQFFMNTYPSYVPIRGIKDLICTPLVCYYNVLHVLVIIIIITPTRDITNLFPIAM